MKIVQAACIVLCVGQNLMGIDGDTPHFRKDGVAQICSQEKKLRKTIIVEIAQTHEQLAQGLMYRPALSDRQGMLFIFPKEEPQTFHMLNTPAPLDIIFADAHKTIVTIYKKTVPYSLKKLLSHKPVLYAIEVCAGFCDQFGVQVGDTLVYSMTDKTTP